MIRKDIVNRLLGRIFGSTKADKHEAIRVYRVIMDYGLPLIKMFEAGKYPGFSSYALEDTSDNSLQNPCQHMINMILKYLNAKDTIEGKNFPFHDNRRYLMDLELEHLDKDYRPISEALNYFKAKCKKEARIEHLLALGSTYPEVQYEFRVVRINLVDKSFIYK